MLIPVHICIYIYGRLRYSCVCPACFWVSTSPQNTFLTVVCIPALNVSMAIAAIDGEPWIRWSYPLCKLVRKDPRNREPGR